MIAVREAMNVRIWSRAVPGYRVGCDRRPPTRMRRGGVKKVRSSSNLAGGPFCPALNVVQHNLEVRSRRFGQMFPGANGVDRRKLLALIDDALNRLWKFLGGINAAIEDRVDDGGECIGQHIDAELLSEVSHLAFADTRQRIDILLRNRDDVSAELDAEDRIIHIRRNTFF